MVGNLQESDLLANTLRVISGISQDYDAFVFEHVALKAR